MKFRSVFTYGALRTIKGPLFTIYMILTCGNMAIHMLSCGNYIFLTFFFPAITLTLQDRTYSDFIANQRRCGRSGSKISTIKISPHWPKIQSKCLSNQLTFRFEVLRKSTKKMLFDSDSLLLPK